MRPTAVVALLGLSTLVACGDDDSTTADATAEWCSTFDDYADLVQGVSQDPTTQPELSDAEAIDLEERFEAFLDDVPDPIAEDWELALPRGVSTPEELRRPERVAAQVRTYEWIVGNCELSAAVDAELRRGIADDRAELDDQQSTHTTLGD